jgi:addiction module HigA family antidote
MKPMCLSSYAVAKAVGTTPITISQIIRNKRGVSAEMAMRLARCFGTSAGFWQGLQADYELEVAELALSKKVERQVVPLHHEPVPA